MGIDVLFRCIPARIVVDNFDTVLKKCVSFFNLIFVIAKEESLNFYERSRGFK